MPIEIKETIVEKQTAKELKIGQWAIFLEEPKSKIEKVSHIEQFLLNEPFCKVDDDLYFIPRIGLCVEKNGYFHLMNMEYRISFHKYIEETKVKILRRAEVVLKSNIEGFIEYDYLKDVLEELGEEEI